MSLELGLRLFWSGYYLKGTQSYAQPHPTRGWANIPNVTLEYGEPEFRTIATHDARGFRNPRPDQEKAGDIRILVLGDSFTYGIGVEDDETFSARLEQLEPRLQVFNSGVNGYGTGQELLLLKELGRELAPDVVILSFFWNDVANNVERDGLRFALRENRVVPPPPKSELPQVGSAPRRHGWLPYSYLYRFTSDRIKSARFWVKWKLGIPHEDGDRLSPARRLDAWRLEHAMIREIRDVSEGLGARFMVVVIPEQVQVQPDAKVLGLAPEDYEVQAQIAEIGTEESIPVLELLPTLRGLYAQTGTPLYYAKDRHFRANAHEVAAREILARLRALEWVPSAAHP